MRGLLIALLLLLSTSFVSAWGPVTHEYACREVVSSVFGPDGIACLEREKVSPAIYPEFILNDTENHYDYSTCPLKWPRGNEWICSGNGSLAKERYQYWMEKSVDSGSLCERVGNFCTATSYYADSKFPLYNVMYLDGCFGGSLAGEVDSKISAGESNWSVEKQCVFSYVKAAAGRNRTISSHVTFTVREEDVERIIDELKALALPVSARGYSLGADSRTTTTTVVISTTATTPQPASTSSTLAPEEGPTTGGPQGTEPDHAASEGDGGEDFTEKDFNETMDLIIEEGMNETSEAIESLLPDFSAGREEAKAKVGNVIIVFMGGMLLASMIFVFYVVMHIRAVQGRRNAGPSMEDIKPRKPTTAAEAGITFKPAQGMAGRNLIGEGKRE